MTPFGVMSEDDRVWKALGDSTRRALLDQLAPGPQTTGALVDAHSELSRTAVMKHLEILVAAGLVVIRREGRQRWNYINPVPIDRICGRWIHGQVRHLSTAVNQLKRLVEFDD